MRFWSSTRPTWGETLEGPACALHSDHTCRVRLLALVLARRLDHPKNSYYTHPREWVTNAIAADLVAADISLRAAKDAVPLAANANPVICHRGVVAND